jgi:hypothetical protein
MDLTKIDAQPGQEREQIEEALLSLERLTRSRGGMQGMQEALPEHQAERITGLLTRWIQGHDQALLSSVFAGRSDFLPRRLSPTAPIIRLGLRATLPEGPSVAAARKAHT